MLIVHEIQQSIDITTASPPGLYLHIQPVASDGFLPQQGACLSFNEEASPDNFSEVLSEMTTRMYSNGSDFAYRSTLEGVSAEFL